MIRSLLLAALLAIASTALAQAQAETRASQLPVPPSTDPQASIVFPEVVTARQPLTTHGKFNLFLTSSISPARLAGAASAASFGQALDSPQDFGQGSEGYAKRFGASMATGASKNFFGNFLLPAAFHQDPRFIISPETGLNQRLKYALRRVVITQTDTGDSAPNWSGLISPFAAQSIANAYLPDRERTVSKTLLRSGIMIGTSAGTNLLKACWPVLTKKLRHR